MKESINPQMIILAREARGLTQQQLAGQISMSATNLSKIERGDIGISDEMLQTVAGATSLPDHFFVQPGSLVPENLAYRKRQAVPQRILTPVTARANMLRLHVQFLTRALNKTLPALPSWRVTEKDTPQRIATRLRHKWELAKPGVDNLTRLLEQQGLAILHFDFGTERVDSRSMLTEDQYPLLLLNSRQSGDRLRFSLAYELAQLVMHLGQPLEPGRDISGEANAFAAELLMPAAEMRKDFEHGLSIPLLAELKKKWKVSMIALLYRADDLGFLTPNQRRYLLQQFNALHIRRREPPELDIPVEPPRLVKRWIAEYQQKTGLNSVEMAAVLCLYVDEFLELYS
jgi:Zn-dependent peptidase ImmA (M78 family)/DNA-binding XRE family transcriptional regulator